MLKQILGREISKVKASRPESPSLRVTIPRRIVNDLKLHSDDFVEWDVSTEKGEMVARIRKLK